MKQTAIITGITGQDGAYLAQLLLKKKYKVYGVVRRSSFDSLYRLKFLKIKNDINYINLNLSEHLKIIEVIRKIKPKYFFNLAAQSFITYAYDDPVYTDQINNQSVINILEAIRKFSKKTRFYQASSSEMYGLNVRNEKKLNEKSYFNPISPYSIAKLSSYHYVKMYRNSFNMFASNGILFNHESPLRGEQFVTKKIVKALTEIKFNKKKNTLKLGNIYSRRDWGHAKNYVLMMYKILNHNQADDFIISSEKQFSVKEFINLVSKKLNYPLKWKGKGIHEKAFNNKNQIIIEISKKYYRPYDINLIGDCSKAKKKLGWKPNKDINLLVDDMINFEINNLNETN
jgi:GDPmannose 4,6-dehydratase